MQLSEIEGITILSGQPTNRVLNKKNEDLPILGTIDILVPKAVSNGAVSHKDLSKEEYVKVLNPDMLTKEGDIIMKLSAPYEACYITEKDEGLLVPAFCCIIRGAGDRAWYIMAYLASSKCQNIISNSCAGSVISMLKVSSVRMLDIPEMEKDKEEQIGTRYMKAVDFKRISNEIWYLEGIRNDSEFN